MLIIDIYRIIVYRPTSPVCRQYYIYRHPQKIQTYISMVCMIMTQSFLDSGNVILDNAFL